MSVTRRALRLAPLRSSVNAAPLDVLVNSAGIIKVPVRPHDLPMASWDDVVRVDQRGTYVACVPLHGR